MKLRQLFEAPRTAVMAFGRMNPPTIGHAKLVDTLKSQDGDPYIFLSQSQKPKTDPLAFADKLRYAKFFFPEITIGHPQVKTIIQALQKINELGYENLIYVAGSDRVPAFEELINKYNGTEYNFKNIQVVSAGERDPDADGAEGMSASKMRAAAAEGDLESFKQGVPNQEVADEMYAAVRQGMGIRDKEEVSESKIAKFLDNLAEAATKADADALTQAVKDFQTKAGITADGKVGPQTRSAMQAAIANTGEEPPADAAEPAQGGQPAAQQPAAQSGAGDEAAAQAAQQQPAAQSGAGDEAAAQAAQQQPAAQQPAAQQPAAQQPAAQQQPAARQAPAAQQQPAARQAPAAGPDDGTRGGQQPAAPAQQAAPASGGSGGSGPGGAYTAADINGGNMPSGLPQETITNIQAAARSARNPNAVVYNPNDNSDF